MKNKIIIVLLLVFFFFTKGYTQRVVIVDTKYILSKMPEYKAVELRMQTIVREWQKELDDMQADVDKMNKNYETEKIMLTPTLKQKRADEIFNKEKYIRTLQTKRFGYEGDYFLEKQKLAKSYQDKLYAAIQKIAIQKGYDLILDKNEGISIIFADPKLDKSDEILKEMGLYGK